MADDEKVQEYLHPKPKEVKIVIAKKTVFQFAEDLIDQLKKDEKTGNAWVYQSTLNALKDFHQADNLHFEEIDYQFLTLYNSFLLKRNLTHNSIYLYVRTIKFFYNKAIKSKIVDRIHYPFDDYKLRPEKTKKRAVDIEIIKAFKNIELIKNTPIWHSRNYFILSFYLIGVSIVDLALLKFGNVQNGRVIYKRRKTGKWYNIKLHSQALEILELYKETIDYMW